MYDTVAKMCDERANVIGAQLNELDAHARRLHMELDFLGKLRGLLQEIEDVSIPVEPHELSPAIKNLLSSVKELDARKGGVDETPNEKFLRIIRENPGISRDELAKLSQINGRQLDNKLGHFRLKKMIENRGTKRPGGARWYVK